MYDTVYFVMINAALKEPWMTANVIRADYDSLAQIAAQFAQESDQSAQMAQSVMVLVQQLESGAWIGMGANSFYSEMNDLVFPALRRLIDALCDAGESTRRISEMLRSAEEEAASLFKGRSEGAAAKAGADPTKGAVTITIPPDGNMPLYTIDMTNLNNVDPDAIARQINPNGRPVLFMMHGFNTPSEAADKSYEAAAAQLREIYANVPPDQRPILIGVKWDAKELNPGELLVGGGQGGITGGIVGGIAGGVFTGFNPIGIITGVKAGTAIGSVMGAYNSAQGTFAAADASAVATGEKFGQILEAFNDYYPESKVNAMAHSLGNKMFMEAVASADVKIDRYLAIQGGVNRDDVTLGGRYSDVLGSEINTMTATYTDSDMAMKAFQMLGYGTGLGYNAEGINRPNYTAVDLDSTDKWLDLNHYGVEDARLRDVIGDVFLP